MTPPLTLFLISIDVNTVVHHGRLDMAASIPVIVIEASRSTAVTWMVSVSARVAGRVRFALMHVQLVHMDPNVNSTVHAKMEGDVIALLEPAG